MEQQTLNAAPDAGTREAAAAAGTGAALDSAKTLKSGGEAAFEKLITGAYKEAYQAKVQKIIDRRFKEAKELAATHKARSPVFSYLAQRTGRDTPDGILLSLLMEEEAKQSSTQGDTGIQSATYGDRSIQDPTKNDISGHGQNGEKQSSTQGDKRARHPADEKLLKAARTYAGWMEEAAEIGAGDPGFDLSALRKNSRFLSLLKAGFSLKEAYRAENQEKFLYEAMRFAAAETKKRVAASLAGRKARPSEGALGRQSAAVFRASPGDMSKKEREEIARRVMRGERIFF